MCFVQRGLRPGHVAKLPSPPSSTHDNLKTVCVTRALLPYFHRDDRQSSKLGSYQAPPARRTLGSFQGVLLVP